MIGIYQDTKSKQSPRVIFFLILLPKIHPHSKEDWATAVSQGQCSKWTSAGIKRTPEKLWAVSGHKKLVCRRAVITEDATFPLPGSLQTASEHPGNAWGHVYRLTMRRASLSWCCPWRYSCQIPQLSLQQPTRYGKQRPSTGKAGEHGKQP